MVCTHQYIIYLSIQYWMSILYQPSIRYQLSILSWPSIRYRPPIWYPRSMQYQLLDTSVQYGPTVMYGPSVLYGPSVCYGPSVRYGPSIQDRPSIRYLLKREGSNKWPYCSHVPTVIEVRAEIYAAGRSCSTPIAPSSTLHDRGGGSGEGPGGARAPLILQILNRGQN